MQRRLKLLAGVCAIAVALAGGALVASAGGPAGQDPTACHASGAKTKIATAKLIIEYNSTDEDIGVHEPGAVVGRPVDRDEPSPRASTGSVASPTTARSWSVTPRSRMTCRRRPRSLHRRSPKGQPGPGSIRCRVRA